MYSCRSAWISMSVSRGSGLNQFCPQNRSFFKWNLVMDFIYMFLPEQVPQVGLLMTRKVHTFVGLRVCLHWIVNGNITIMSCAGNIYYFNTDSFLLFYYSALF